MKDVETVREASQTTLWAVLIFLFLLLVAALLYLQQSASKAELQNTLSRLKAAGEPLEWAALGVNPEQTASEGFEAWLIPLQEIKTENRRLEAKFPRPSAMPFQNPGVAVLSTQLPAIHEASAYQQKSSGNSSDKADKQISWEDFIAEWAASRKALDQAKKIFLEQEIRFPLGLQHGVEAPLDHISTQLDFAKALLADSLIALRQKDLARLAENHRCFGKLGKFSDASPLMISFLVDVTVENIQHGLIWQQLELGVGSDSDWAELAGILESYPEPLEKAARILRGERIMGYITMQKILNRAKSRTGQPLDITMLFGYTAAPPGLDGILAGIYSSLYRTFLSHADIRSILEFQQAQIEHLETHYSKWEYPRFMAELERLGIISGGHPFLNQYTLPMRKILEDLTDSIFSQIYRHHTSRNLTRSALALERYRRQHRRYPDSLADCCPQLLPQPLSDPYLSAPLQYRKRVEGRYLLYSLGENATDEGGDPKMPSSRYYRWDRALDVVWPQSTRQHPALTPSP
ncbi:MAG: hypothetical protein HC904_08815 [Blastochloris sp.]|nr:hypothetical protein [Blastochloris sp.]